MRVIDTNTIAAPPATIATDELTLGEVAEIINRLKTVPTLDEVQAWFSALLLRQRDYERLRSRLRRKWPRRLGCSETSTKCLASLRS